MEVRMAEHHGMCFGVRDAMDLALDLTRQGPLTILGDLVHNPDVVAAHGRRRGRAAPAARRGADAGRAADGPRHLRPGQAAAARAGPPGPRRHLSPGEAGPPGPAQAGGRGATPRRHRPGRPRRGARPGRRLGRLHDRSGGRRPGQLDDRLRRDPAARLGVVAQTTQPLERVVGAGRGAAAAVSRGRRAFHRHRLPADQGPPGGPAANWSPRATWWSWSAARTATTAAS